MRRQAHTDERNLFSSACDQALVQPQSLSLGETLGLVVSHQSTLDLCSREEEQCHVQELTTETGGPRQKIRSWRGRFLQRKEIAIKQRKTMHRGGCCMFYFLPKVNPFYA